MSKSRRYPEPQKQVDAGYFWLTIGLAISWALAVLRPAGHTPLMYGLVGYGIFHLLAGKRNLRREQDEWLTDDLTWLEEASESSEDADESNQWWLVEEPDVAAEPEEAIEPDFYASLNGDDDDDDYLDFQGDDELPSIEDEDIFAKSWRAPEYEWNEDDDVEDPPDIAVSRVDYYESD